LLQEPLLHAHVFRDAGNEGRKLVDFAEEVVLDLAEKLGVESIQHRLQVAHAGLHVGVELGQQGFLQEGVVGVFVAVAPGPGLLEQLVARQGKSQPEQAANHGDEHAPEKVLHVAVAERGVGVRVLRNFSKRVAHQRHQPQNGSREGAEQPQVQGGGNLGLNFLVQGLGVALGNVFQNAKIGGRAAVVQQVLVGVDHDLPKLRRGVTGDEGIVLNGKILLGVGGRKRNGLHRHRPCLRGTWHSPDR
jgi:hypothetical protein